jgi:hypothetical protein
VQQIEAYQSGAAAKIQDGIAFPELRSLLDLGGYYAGAP